MNLSCTKKYFTQMAHALTGLILVGFAIVLKDYILGIQSHSIYIFFYPILVLAFYCFTITTGIVFLIVSPIVIDYLYVYPKYHFVFQLEKLPELFLYMLSASFIGLMIHQLKTTNLKLKKSEENYRNAFIYAPTAIIRVNARNFRIQDANQQALKLFGYGLMDLNKLTIFDITHPDHFSQTQMVKTQLAKGELHHFENEKRYLKSDKTAFWAKLSATTEYDNHGNVKTILENIIDITKSKALEEHLYDQANIDVLTNVFNRRYLEDRAMVELSKVQNHAPNLTLLVIDVDHFKSINDKYGHQFGDDVLRKLAFICKEQLRGYDIFGRYGGEEFIAVLPQTNISDGLEVAERLRSTLYNTKLLTDANTELQFSVSIGITAMIENDTFRSLMKRADIALYNAKKQGRNCVVLE